SLLENFANAFKGNCQRLEVFRFANGAERLKPTPSIHQVIRTGAKHRIDLVVAEAFLFTENKSCSIDQKIEHLSFLLSGNGALWGIRMQAFRRGPHRPRQGERQLLLQYNFHCPQCRTPQCEWVARSSRHHSYREAANNRIQLVGKRNGAADQIAWDRIVESDWTIVVVDRVRNFIRFALSFGIKSAHNSLQLRKF